jgi:P4 family phage/plasmid primase-like protien
MELAVTAPSPQHTTYPVIAATGTGALTLRFSLFPEPAATSTTATPYSGRWCDLATLLTRHERRADKDGRGWSPAIYPAGATRKNENVEAVSAFVVDIDHAQFDDLAEIKARLGELGLAAAIYSTFSNDPPDAVRFRVAVPFTAPVPTAQWGDVWFRANQHLFGGRGDTQAKDAARFYYLPSAPPDVAVFAEVLQGDALDPATLPAVTLVAIGPTGDTPNRGAIDRLGRRALDFVANGAPVAHQRGEALAAARSYLAAGYSVADTAEKIWRGLQASPCGDPADPWTYAQAEELVRDLAKRDAPRLTPLTPAGGLYKNGTGHPGDVSPPNGRGREDGGGVPPLPPLTDTGNGELLVSLFGEDLLYVYETGQWLHYQQGSYHVDRRGTVEGMTKKVARHWYALAADMDDDEQRKNVVKHARRSESAAAREAMVRCARSEPGIAALLDDLDADPMLLNCANGTLDLRDGTLQAHRREDRLTKQVPTAYDETATCPTWERFLEEILPDAPVRRFVKRWLGYCITGDVSEQCLVFAHGGGANGKSTLAGAIMDALGPYARQAAPDLLTYHYSERHPTELADLVGVRFVVSVEVDEGKRLAEALLKQLTGGERVKARRMRQDFFEFLPSHKIFLAANHQPVIRGTDYAIWRRIHRVPFTVTIAEGDRDPKLPERLRAERAGILRWLVEGCLEWQRDGLGVPEAVRQATNEYRAEQDVLADFIDDCCELTFGASVEAKGLYEAYTRWCDANGEKALSQKVLGPRLTERGLARRRSGAGGRWAWHGVRLLNDRGATEPLRTVVQDKQLPTPREDVMPGKGSDGSVDAEWFSRESEQSAPAVQQHYPCPVCGQLIPVDGDCPHCSAEERF